MSELERKESASEEEKEEQQTPSAQPAEKAHRRRGEHLDHFYQMGNQDENLRANVSFFDSLAESFESLKASRKRMAAGGGATLKDYTLLLLQYKKIAALVVSLILLLIVLALVVPVIPLQIQRSTGFAAFGQHNYTEAFGRLTEYLKERPNDHVAAYTAAQAALYTNDYDYARDTINDLYEQGKLNNIDISYHYALINVEQSAQAEQALSSVLKADPDHIGARLLRGVLLGQQEQFVRQARDDFLQLDEILRGDVDASTLLFLHRYLMQTRYLVLNYQPPKYEGHIESPVLSALGVESSLDGFIFNIQYSEADKILAEEIAPGNIVHLYFTYMLLMQNEIEEAESVLTGLQRTAANLLVVQQLSAIHSMYKGDYAEAEKMFNELYQQLPTDSKTANNLVIAKVLAATDGEIDVNEVADSYESLLSADNADDISLNNGGYFMLLAGRYQEAGTLLNRISAKGADSLQVSLNRALLAWTNQDVSTAREELKNLMAEDVMQAGDYLVALYEKNNEHELAFDVLKEMSQQQDSRQLLISRVKIMEKLNDWHLAFSETWNFLRKDGDDAEVHYLHGKQALKLGNSDSVATERAELERLAAEDDSQQHYFDAFQGALMHRAGNNESAADFYYKAMQGVADKKKKHDYAIAWADIYADIDPARVAQVLGEYIQEYETPELKSLLAYVLADDDGRQAVEYAKEAIAGSVASDIVAIYAGAALVKIGNYAGAIPLLELAASRQPVNVRVLSYLQQAYAGVDDSERSERVSDTLLYLQNLVASDGDEKASYKVYLPRIKDIVDSVRVALGKGAGDKEYKKAEKAYSDALAQEDDSQKRAELLYSKATFEAYLKNYNQAIDTFEEALAIGITDKDKQLNAMLFYAEVLALTEQHGKAVPVLKRVLEIDNTLLNQRLYAIALAKDMQYTLAIEVLNKLLVSYPADRLTYRELADLYALTEQYQAAVVTLRKLFFIYPNYAPAYLLLAEIYTLLGEHKKSKDYSAIYASLGKSQ